MKKQLISILVMVFLLVGISGYVLADYTPLPGVEDPANIDFGGATVYLSVPTDARWTFGEGAEREGRLEEAEELFNVTIEQLPEKISLNLVMNRVMAGEATHDIYRFPQRYNIYGLLAQGALFPVGDILPEDYFNSLSGLDPFEIETFSYRGVKYGFGSVHNHFGIIKGVTYNKTMLDREDLPDIWDLYDAGEWTWDMMEELAEAVTRDTTGDGEIDQWGISTNNLIINMLIANGASFMEIDEREDYKFNWNSPEAINALNIMQRWYEKGLITDGRVRDGDNVLMQTMYDAWGDDRVPVEGDIKSLAPLPIGPDVDRHYFPMWNSSNWYIPITAQDPEGLIALLEFLFRPDDETNSHQGTLFEWISARFRDEDAARFVTHATENFKGEVWTHSAFGGTVVEPPVGLLWEIVTGEKAAAATMDEVAPEIQAQLNELFGQ